MEIKDKFKTIFWFRDNALSCKANKIRIQARILVAIWRTAASYY